MPGPPQTPPRASARARHMWLGPPHDGGRQRRGAGQGGWHGGEEEGEGRNMEQVSSVAAMVEKERKREEVGNDEWGSHVTLPETVRLPCAQRFAVC